MIKPHYPGIQKEPPCNTLVGLSQRLADHRNADEAPIIAPSLALATEVIRLV
jgi:hypothetical protein